MPIYSPTGFLDITNATLRTSNTECQNLKIGTGNLYVTSEISPSFELNLSNVTSLGATSPHTLTLSNVTTAIDITSGNLKIGGLIYTKDWGIRAASGSNDLYVGHFTVHGITEVLITDQGASLGSASKFTITRNVDSTPLVNGIDSSSTVNYEWYYTSDNPTTYHLWVHPTSPVQTNIKVTSSTYIPVDEPTSPTLIPCANGLINMSGNVVASQNLTVSGNVVASQNLTISGNTFYTSPMSVSVDSNVVTEYTGPHDRPLRKYPEVALTSASDSGYVTSSSTTVGTYYTWNAFDNNLADDSSVWTTVDNIYDSNDDYAYNSNKSLGVVDGEWLKIKLPNKIKPSYVRIYPRTYSPPIGNNQSPEDFKILASNDDSNWVELVSVVGWVTNATWGRWDISSETPYKYFAIVCTRTIGAATFGLAELEYYGYEEGSGSLDTTLKTVYNVPATTGTQLEVYYDAKGESTVQSPIPDLSPNTNTGALSTSPPTLDTTDGIESFKFDASSSQRITSTIDTSYWGTNKLHSVAFWFKADTISGKRNIFHIGNPAASESSGFWISDGSADVNTGNSLNWWFYGGDSNTKVSTFSWSVDTWYHIALTFDGSTKKMYVNGHHIDFSVGNVITTLPTGIPASASLAVGGTTNSVDYFDGSIANFRVYGAKVLNTDQVKELYDYQKDYFLGSKSQVTLYKGHLGVGVTEPSGQLELAGDERIQEYPPRGLYQHDTHVEGHGVFCVSASAEHNTDHQVWEAFGDNATSASSESVWNSLGAMYVIATGAYTSSTTTSGIKGEWIQMKTPYKVKISSFILDSYATSGRRPRDFVLLGSNDGNVWEQMKSVSGQTTGYTMNSPYATSFGGPHHTVNSTKFYTYFRIVITHVQPSGDGLAAVGRLRFFGTPGPTTLDKGSLTLGRSLDVPRVSRYDVDTETPRPEKLLIDYDTTVNSSLTDISGQGNHGAFFGGASYSAPDKAFTFDGGDYSVTVITIPGGNMAWTQSMWFKSKGFSVSTNFNVLSFFGSKNPGASHIWNYKADQMWQDHYGRGVYFNYTFEENIWYHAVSVYHGNTSTDANVRSSMYINGVKQTLIASGLTAAAQTIPTTTNYELADYISGTHSSGAGGNARHNGLISNVKFYSVALEPSEVKKLYRLGRTGRSMVISDTAVGIGKVPEAQLDVRGNMIVRGAITNDYYACFEVNESYYTTPDYLSWKSNDNQISFNSGITLINQSEIELGVPGIYMAFVKLNSDSAQSGRGVVIYAQYYDGATWHTEISNGQLSIDYNGGTEVMTQHMLRATTHTKWRFYMTHTFTNAPSPPNRFFVASGQWSRLMISKIA